MPLQLMHSRKLKRCPLFHSLELGMSQVIVASIRLEQEKVAVEKDVIKTATDTRYHKRGDVGYIHQCRPAFKPSYFR